MTASIENCINDLVRDKNAKITLQHLTDLLASTPTNKFAPVRQAIAKAMANATENANMLICGVCIGLGITILTVLLAVVSWVNDWPAPAPELLPFSFQTIGGCISVMLLLLAVLLSIEASNQVDVLHRAGRIVLLLNEIAEQRDNADVNYKLRPTRIKDMLPEHPLPHDLMPLVESEIYSILIPSQNMLLIPDLGGDDGTTCYGVMLAYYDPSDPDAYDDPVEFALANQPAPGTGAPQRMGHLETVEVIDEIYKTLQADPDPDIYVIRDAE